MIRVAKRLLMIFLTLLPLSMFSFIVVSVNPIYLIVKEIVQNEVELKVLIPSNVNPHLYQLKISDMTKFEKADLIILLGKGFEEWFDKVSSAFRDKVLVLSQGILEESFSENPHIWLDPVLVSIMSYRVYEKLTEIFPKKSEVFRDNFWKFYEKLMNFSDDLHRKLEGIRGKPVVESHPALYHFVRRFLGSDVFFLETGHGEGVSLKKVKEAIRFCRKNKIKYLIKEKNIPSKILTVLSKETKLEIREVDVLGTSAKDYFEILENIAGVLLR